MGGLTRKGTDAAERVTNLANQKHLNYRIFTSGGVGNQLFQYSFGHFLQSELNAEVTILHLPVPSKFPHTQINLLSQLDACSHCKVIEFIGSPNINSLVNPWSKSLSVVLWGKKFDARERPFISRAEITGINSKRLIVGYFQNREFIQPVKEELYNEIFGMLKKFPIDLFTNETNLEVIHVRGGDYLSTKNQVKIGNLDDQFYRRNLASKSRMTRVVVTNDIEYAKFVMRGIDYDLMLGGDQLNTFQTLGLMARASRLLVANSTFSWWGGFMASQAGAEVLIPKPFFKSSHLDSKDSLDFANFTPVRSTFSSKNR